MTAACDAGGPGDERDALPALPRELDSWFAPTRPRAEFKPPQDLTRMLLVEDDPLHRRIIRVVLHSPRISLIEVTHGQAALDLLAMKSFDLVMLGGLHRSCMTRDETVKWIRTSLTPWADIAILALLEPGEVNHAQRMMSDGVTDWARYPVKRAEFVAKLVGLMPGLHDAGL
jgi:CheY-like chemotaxis protein